MYIDTPIYIVTRGRINLPLGVPKHYITVSSVIKNYYPLYNLTLHKNMQG